MEKSIGIIILAAGNSSRLGQPKQLLQYKIYSLLQHVVTEALQLNQDNIIVVTGANESEIEADLIGYNITTVNNKNWEEGLGSSIAVGVKQLLLINPAATACILAVCDQPFVSSELFRSLVQKFQQNNNKIVASSYADTIGTPVLFGCKFFSKLFRLKGPDGAKKVLLQYQSEVVTVPFEKGAFDIDTMADYEQLLKQS